MLYRFPSKPQCIGCALRSSLLKITPYHFYVTTSEIRGAGTDGALVVSCQRFPFPAPPFLLPTLTCRAHAITAL
mgnify:CR=1 FL=1